VPIHIMNFSIHLKLTQFVDKGKNLTKRTDDNVEVAVKRYETYEKSTEPVINFYEKLKLVKEINGEDKIESIYSKIDQFLSVIEG
jgi:Adenylate kinase and related kinases